MRMCGRMVILTYDEAADVVRSMRRGEVLNPFPDWPAIPPRKDAYPQSWVPIAIPSAGTLDTLEVEELNWGYPVEWRSGPIFNTRLESIEQGVGMWAESAERRRCLVPVVKFYERHATETARSRKTGRLVKRQYEFQLVDEPIMWIAGVYENDHFSLVTTKPNDAVAPIHNRMPLVLARQELARWLEGDFALLGDRTGLQLLVKPEDEPARGPSTDSPQQLSLF